MSNERNAGEGTGSNGNNGINYQEEREAALASPGVQSAVSEYQEKAEEIARRNQADASGGFSASRQSASSQPGAFSSVGGAVTATDPKAQVRRDLTAAGNVSRPGAYSSSGGATTAAADSKAQVLSDLQTLGTPGTSSSSGGVAADEDDPKARVRRDLESLGTASKPGAFSSSGGAAAAAAADPKAQVRRDLATLNNASSPNEADDASDPKARVRRDLAAMSSVDRQPGAVASSSSAHNPKGQNDLASLENEIRDSSSKKGSAGLSELENKISSSGGLATVPGAQPAGPTVWETVENIKAGGRGTTADNYHSSTGEADLQRDIAIVENKALEVPLVESGIPGAYAEAPTGSNVLDNSITRMEDSAQEAALEDASEHKNTTEKMKDETHKDVEAATTLGEDGLAQAVPVQEDDLANIAVGTPDEDVKRRQLEKDQKFRNWAARLGALLCLIIIAVVVAVVLTRPDKEDKEVIVATQEPSEVPTGAPTLAPTPFAVGLPDFTIEALQDPESPQSLAYRWLQEDPNLGEYEEPKRAQRMALATFYYATLGDEWTVNDSWLSYEVDECDWYNKYNVSYEASSEGGSSAVGLIVGGQYQGVDVCDEKGNFLSLVLSSNGLIGTLPKELSLLSGLERMDVSGNQIKSEIPREIGKLASLKELSIQENMLTGILPSELGELSKLQFFVCNGMDGNGLSGVLPSELGNALNMRELDISQNPLITGPLPDLSRMKNLSFLVSRANSLTGEISSNIGLLTNLELLRVSGNSLSGSLPSEIGLLTKLTYLGINHNFFSNRIPTEIGSMESLQSLQMEGNQLSGSIPSQIGQLQMLMLVGLGLNSFTGSVPQEIWDMSSLFGIDISRNTRLQGPLPAEFGAAATLQALGVYDLPNWAGSIPSSVGLLSNLEFLFLANANLNGAVPDLTLLSSLQFLRLEGNPLLKGNPFQRETNGTSLLSIKMNETMLSGKIPQSYCVVPELWFDCGEMCGCECLCQEESE